MTLQSPQNCTENKENMINISSDEDVPLSKIQNLKLQKTPLAVSKSSNLPEKNQVQPKGDQKMKNSQSISSDDDAPLSVLKPKFQKLNEEKKLVDTNKGQPFRDLSVKKKKKQPTLFDMMNKNKNFKMVEKSSISPKINKSSDKINLSEQTLDTTVNGTQKSQASPAKARSLIKTPKTRHHKFIIEGIKLLKKYEKLQEKIKEMTEKLPDLQEKVQLENPESAENKKHMKNLNQLNENIKKTQTEITSTKNKLYKQIAKIVRELNTEKNKHHIENCRNHKIKELVNKKIEKIAYDNLTAEEKKAINDEKRRKRDEERRVNKQLEDNLIVDDSYLECDVNENIKYESMKLRVG